MFANTIFFKKKKKVLIKIKHILLLHTAMSIDKESYCIETMRQGFIYTIYGNIKRFQ